MFLLLVSTVIETVSARLDPTSNMNPSSRPSTHCCKGHPFEIFFWFNGFPDVGLLIFYLPQGRPVSLDVSLEYPFSSPGLSPIPVSFSLAPFPVTSTIPSWLSVTPPPTVILVSGLVEHITVELKVEGTTPNGESGEFELQARYIDPVTGWDVTHVMTLKIVADSSASVRQSTFSLVEPTVVKLGDPSWALGPGLCSSNNTGNCGYGVAWNQVTAIESTFTVPGWAPPSPCSGGFGACLTFINVNAGIAYDYILQFMLCQFCSRASNSSSGNWGIQIAYIEPIRNVYHSANVGTYASGQSITMELAHDPTNGWYAYDLLTQWFYSGYFTGVPNVSTLFEYNQEPFAFESYDTVGGDFNPLYINVNPAAHYYITSWNDPTSAIALPGNAGHSRWCGGRSFCVLIGGNVTVPSSFVEAGNFECSSIPVAQIYIGSNTQGLLQTCHTNTFGISLWL